MNPDPYCTAKSQPTLPPGEVHIWRARISERTDLSALEGTLSIDERRRVQRYHFAADRDRAVAARGILRRLLGQYLQIAPVEIAFVYGPQGKPELDDTAAANNMFNVSFNLAHSGDLALYAFARDRRLGIDVELLRDVPEAMAIARNHFTPAESRLLTSLGGDLQSSFFRLWTRKEAVIKAVGTGVSTPLHEFDVSSASAVDIGWQHVSVPSQPVPSWNVCDIPVVAGYRAALAVEVDSIDETSSKQSASIHFWRERD